ncbi:MAG: hypothetical protein IBX68_03335 [Dehalococcoidia bacterium]|nr:hypothetical protein [Dehalococcoidia bacterium]
MPVWKYAKSKEVTTEDIDRVLSSLACFKCGKDLHSDDCPFARLRAELNALKASES